MNEDANFDALPPESVSQQAGVVADLKKPRRRRKPASSLNIDRLPPNSTEAEQGLLACCLLSPREVLPEVIARFKDDVEILYDLRHQTIYTAMCAMYALDENGIDIITLQQWLQDEGELEQIGGIAYLNALQDCAPSAANVSYYIEIVIEKYLLRKAIYVCTDCVASVYEHSGDVNELLDRIESNILAIRGRMVKSESVGMLDLMQRCSTIIDRIANRPNELNGLATGFADLDKMLCGLHNGEMIVIAGRPSLGKTSLAMNICETVALNLRLPVGVFSLEMTDESLGMRLLSSQAKVNIRNMREGFMAETDFPKLTSAAGRLSNAPIRIDPTPGLSIMELRARARKMWQQYGIKLFVVDYLQLLHSTSKRAQENRQHEISEISSGIKALAKELNVPIIVLSQLNREIERQKRKPNLSDLRESGAIEQDSDVVGLLYKPSVGDDEDAVEEADGIPVNLLIAKQRNGPTGDVNLTFLKPYTRFESAAKVCDDDVPSEAEQQQLSGAFSTTEQ